MLHVYSDQGRLGRFQQQLADKLEGRVDLDTILWIWDQYAELKNGYYQEWRKVMLDDMAKLGPSATSYSLHTVP